MRSVEKKLIEFQYLGKSYLGKLYKTTRVSIYVFVIFFAVFFSEIFEAFLAYEEIKTIEEINFMQGSIQDRIMCMIASLIAIFIIIVLENYIWKIIKGDKKVYFIRKNEKYKHIGVPMTISQIRFGKCFVGGIIFIITSALLILADWDFIQGAIDVVWIYLGNMVIEDIGMKRSRCKYFIPLQWKEGFIAVKEVERVIRVDKNGFMKSDMHGHYVG